MAQAPGTSSSQYSVLASFGTTVSAGTIAHVEAADGTTIFTFKPSKNYQTLVFSAPELKSGATYKLYTGGSSTGTATDGLYSGGAYTAGTLKSEFTLGSVVTRVQ